MAERKLRRKSVTVSFSGDDDVVQHIVDAHAKKPARGGKRRSVTRGKPSKCEDDIDEESGEEADKAIGASTVLEDENCVFGGDVYRFKTPKKSSQMAQVAADARTPKSILKTPIHRKEATPRKSVGFTPSKEGSTPSTPTQRRVTRHSKPEATTPYRLHKRQGAGDSDSDDSLDDSDDDDSDASEDKSSTRSTPVKPLSTQNTPANTPTRSNRKKLEAVDMPNMVEEYFDIHAGGVGPTSDTTLAKLDMPRMDQEALNATLSSVSTSHVRECKQMYDEYRDLFSDWMFHMCNGFNMLLYGLGSKRSLIEDFRHTMINEFSHVVINGYFPSLTVKHILNSITEDLLDHTGSFKGPLDQVEYIRTEINKSNGDFFLVIHNIDGTMLRNEKAQNVLSLLGQIPGLHIIASIDHINASLVWDQAKCSRFNWLWHDATTFASYMEETSYENSLLVQQSGGLALSSLTHVMKSLTPNAKGIFLLLAGYQLENRDNTNYLGMAMSDLYQRCRESFLVNSDLTLQAQLTEFRDHKMIRSKKNFDGVEHLVIPIDAGTLTEFVEQQNDT